MLLAIENFFLGPRIVLDISKDPCLRSASLGERLTRWYHRDSVFFASEGDLARLETVCSNMLKNIQAGAENAPTLTKVLQIHDRVYEIRGKENVLSATQEKASNVAANVFKDFSQAFGTVLPRTREQLLPTYLSSAQIGLPGSQKTLLSSVLKAAGVLQWLSPDQANELIQSVNQAADKIRSLQQDPLPTGREEVGPCQACTEKVLQEAFEQINPATDAHWEQKLRILLAAINKLTEPLGERVRTLLQDPITLLMQRREFPGFTLVETVELLESLFHGRFKWASDHQKAVNILASSHAKAVVTQLEEAIRERGIDQQINCVNRLVTMRESQVFSSFSVRALDPSVVQAFHSNVNVFAGRFWDGRAYNVLHDLAPEVAEEYASRVMENSKKQMPSENITDKYIWLKWLEGSPVSRNIPEKVREFLNQQFLNIASDIGQGRIKLANIVEKEEGENLIELIVSSCEYKMDALVKTLGDNSKAFFDIYGNMKARQIVEKLKQGALNDALKVLRPYLRVPLTVRRAVNNPIKSQLQLALDTFGKAAFAEPIGSTKFMTIIEFGQLCRSAKMLFFPLQITLHKLSDSAVESIVKEIKQTPLGRLVPKLIFEEGKGLFEYPLDLIDALPIEDGQRARLIKACKDSAPQWW